MSTASANSNSNAAPIKKERNYLDLFFKPVWISALLSLAIPLTTVLGSGNYNAIQKGLFLIAGICFTLKSAPARPIVTVGFFMIFVSIFLFGSLTEFQSFNWVRTLNATIALASILIFYLATPNKEDRLFMLKTIAAMAPALVISGYIFLLTHGRPVYALDNTGVTRLCAATIPSFLAAASYASTIAYAMLYRYSKKMPYLLLAVFCLFISVLSGSRMPTVCALACLAAIIFFALQSALSRIAFICSGIAFIVIGLFTFGQNIMVRFTSQTSSGRDIIWNSVLAWADRMPYTGIGFGHHSFVIPEYIQLMTKTKATHNEYIRIFAELGYIGSSIFGLGILLLYYFSTIKRVFSDYIVTFAVLGTFLMFSYSDNTLTLTYCLFAPLAYALASGLSPLQPAGSPK